jgi:hypothetical protein
VTFGCSTIGLVVGTISAVRQSGGHRAFGVFVAVVSLAVVVAGIFKLTGISG